MGSAGMEGDADDAFELVGKPRAISGAAAQLATQPARPRDSQVRAGNCCCCRGSWVADRLMEEAAGAHGCGGTASLLCPKGGPGA